MFFAAWFIASLSFFVLSNEKKSNCSKFVLKLKSSGLLWRKVLITLALFRWPGEFSCFFLCCGDSRWDFVAGVNHQTKLRAIFQKKKLTIVDVIQKVFHLIFSHNKNCFHRKEKKVKALPQCFMDLLWLTSVILNMLFVNHLHLNWKFMRDLSMREKNSPKNESTEHFEDKKINKKKNKPCLAR